MSSYFDKDEIDRAQKLTLTANQQARKEIADQIEQFLKSGGEIQKIPSAYKGETVRSPSAYGYTYDKPIPPGIRYFKKLKVWKTQDANGFWTGRYATMARAELAQISYSTKVICPNESTHQKTSTTPKPHKKIALSKKPKHSSKRLLKHIEKFYSTT